MQYLFLGGLFQLGIVPVLVNFFRKTTDCPDKIGAGGAIGFSVVLALSALLWGWLLGFPEINRHHIIETALIAIIFCSLAHWTLRRS